MSLTVDRVGPDEGPALRAVRLAALAESPGAFASTWEAESALTDDEWDERAR